MKDKKIKIRQAKKRDRGLFLKLMKQFMEEEYEKDPGAILPTKHNLKLFGQYFDAYLEGQLEGVVLFFRENAFLMYGDQGSAFEFAKKKAMGFAVYVEEDFREQGVAQTLRTESLKLLKEMGFDEVIGMNILNNEKALKSSKTFGFKPTAQVVKIDLNEEIG